MMIRDPVYRLVEVEGEFRKIIDNPFFQRLRNIKQNSLLFHVFPSAKHDRFSHSLGAYHLMRKVVENGHLDITDEESFNCKAAALLHDVGHGPYSHLWEVLVPGFDHEAMSVRIIREVFGLPVAAAIVAKRHRLSPLLSSVIDVDKLDYMARDSYFCGVGYGNTDVERIVNHLSVHEGKVVLSPKIVASAEHVIAGRVSLYKATYFHHYMRANDFLLLSIVRRARRLFEEGGGIFFDDSLRSFLSGKGSLDGFLALDDSVIEYHLQRWRSCSDPVVSDLTRRFFSRKGFAAINVEDVDVNPEKVRAAVVAAGFDPEWYFCDDLVDKTVYEEEAFVRLGKGLVPLSVRSPFVEAVASVPLRLRYLIGPKEVIKRFKRS